MMKYAGAFLLAVVCSWVLPSGAFSDVRIYLKNGSTITADGCEESGGALVCYRAGGAFELEKNEVERVREIAGSADSGSTPEPPGNGTTQDKSGPGKGDAADKPAGKGAAMTPQQEFDQIQQKKVEMQKEREKLAQEREKLQGELKKAPDWMPDKQFDELKKRNTELDEKVKKFNEEVKRLDAEEKKIPGVQPKQEKKKEE